MITKEHLENLFNYANTSLLYNNFSYTEINNYSDQINKLLNKCRLKNENGNILENILKLIKTSQDAEKKFIFITFLLKNNFQNCLNIDELYTLKDIYFDSYQNSHLIYDYKNLMDKIEEQIFNDSLTKKFNNINVSPEKFCLEEKVEEMEISAPIFPKVPFNNNSISYNFLPNNVSKEPKPFTLELGKGKRHIIKPKRSFINEAEGKYTITQGSARKALSIINQSNPNKISNLPFNFTGNR